jgi:hypothetical protein
MRPYSDINIMDVYQNPITMSEWVVNEKNDKEKMISIIMLSNLPAHLNKPIWKRNTDRIFNKRVQEGIRTCPQNT